MNFYGLGLGNQFVNHNERKYSMGQPKQIRIHFQAGSAGGAGCRGEDNGCKERRKLLDNWRYETFKLKRSGRMVRSGIRQLVKELCWKMHANSQLT